MHPAEFGEDELLAECEISRTRRSGPGGQHRNKVETAIVLTHTPSGIIAQASERRSQTENRSVAIIRLRILLAVQVRSRRQLSSGPSDLWRSRARGTRIDVNETHADFPALLAESLDLHEQFDCRLPELAEYLGTSASQLVKLWKKEPAALSSVNELRVARGLRLLE